MDPNGSKKGIFNKLSKMQAIEKLNNELFNRKTVSFYRYVILDTPLALRDKLYLQWKELGVLGRIYIAHEGINAQLSVPENNWTKFVSNIKVKFIVCLISYLSETSKSHISLGTSLDSGRTLSGNLTVKKGPNSVIFASFSKSVSLTG